MESLSKTFFLLALLNLVGVALADVQLIRIQREADGNKYWKNRLWSVQYPSGSNCHQETGIRDFDLAAWNDEGTVINAYTDLYGKKGCKFVLGDSDKPIPNWEWMDVFKGDYRTPPTIVGNIVCQPTGNNTQAIKGTCWYSFDDKFDMRCGNATEDSSKCDCWGKEQADQVMVCQWPT